MSVQLAVAPIAWSNSDLPQLGRHSIGNMFAGES